MKSDVYISKETCMRRYERLICIMCNRDVHEYQFKKGLYAYQLLHINLGLLWVLYIGMKSDVYI